MRLDLASAPAYQALVARSGQVVLAFGLPAGILGAVLAVAWLSSSTSTDGLGPMRFLPFSPRSTPGAPPPSLDQTPPPTTLEQISPEQAELRNALIPYSRAPLLTAARYIPTADGESVETALPCLTRAIYYEAAREPVAGQRAVAQVIINRWASAPFPKTICGVVEQGAPRPGCQFTFECDGSLAKRPDPTLLSEAEAVARAALNGYVASEIGAATHYHADYVVPVWATTMLKLTKIGHHIFYRWPGARPQILQAIAPDPLQAPGDLPGDPGEALGGALPPAASTASAPVEDATPAATPPPNPSDVTPAAAPKAPTHALVPEPTTSAAPAITSSKPAQAPRRAIPERSLRVGPF